MPPKGVTTYTHRPGKGLFQQMKEVSTEPIARHEREPSTEQTAVPHPNPRTGDVRIAPGGRSAGRSTPALVASPDAGNSNSQSAVSQAPIQACLRITLHGNS